MKFPLEKKDLLFPVSRYFLFRLLSRSTRSHNVVIESSRSGNQLAEFYLRGQRLFLSLDLFQPQKKKNGPARSTVTHSRHASTYIRWLTTSHLGGPSYSGWKMAWPQRNLVPDQRGSISIDSVEEVDMPAMLDTYIPTPCAYFYESVLNQLFPSNCVRESKDTCSYSQTQLNSYFYV